MARGDVEILLSVRFDYTSTIRLCRIVGASQDLNSAWLKVVQKRLRSAIARTVIYPGLGSSKGVSFCIPVA